MALLESFLQNFTIFWEKAHTIWECKSFTQVYECLHIQTAICVLSACCCEVESITFQFWPFGAASCSLPQTPQAQKWPLSFSDKISKG